MRSVLLFAVALLLAPSIARADTVTVGLFAPTAPSAPMDLRGKAH